MCGISGMVAKNVSGFNSNHIDIFEEMLYAGGVRGMDSTGCFSILTKNQIKLVKQAANPGIFINTKSYKEWKSDLIQKARIIVGHNRKATNGVISSKNAHPFSSKKIVLVHNGYISNAKHLDKEIEVDSESIITALDSSQTPIDAIQKLCGAYVVVWYNHDTKKLYLTRNKERPLFICQNKDFLYFASEKEMLEWTLLRNYEYPDGDIEEVAEDILYEISLNPFTLEKTVIPSTFRETTTKYPLVPASYHRTVDFPYEQPEGDTSCLDDRAGVDHLRAVADELPMTELGRMRAMAKAEAEEAFSKNVTAELMHLVRKTYPDNTKVLFHPNLVVPEGQHLRIFGDAWWPGKTPIKAYHVISVSTDKEDYINPDAPLIATVAATSRKNKELMLCLKHVYASKSLIKVFNKIWLSEEEWKAICATRNCDSCANPILTQHADMTTVVRENTGYTITCANCTTQPADTEDNNTGYGG